MSERIHIWHEHRDMAMLALGYLLDQCDDDLQDEPMVLLVDGRDDEGAKIVEDISAIMDQDENIDGLIAGGEDGIIIVIVPTQLVQAATVLSNPDCSEALDSAPPDGCMWAAVIASEGMTLLHVPVEPFRSIGSA